MILYRDERQSDSLHPYFDKVNSKDGVVALLTDRSIGIEKLGRLIIYGEFKRFDEAQEEYSKLRNDKYTNSTLGERLTEYKEKYNLQD